MSVNSVEPKPSLTCAELLDRLAASEKGGHFGPDRLELPTPNPGPRVVTGQAHLKPVAHPAPVELPEQADFEWEPHLQPAAEFGAELLRIEDEDIRFWTQLHLEQSCTFDPGVIEHTRQAASLLEKLINLFDLSPLEADQARSAILLHDGAKLDCKKGNRSRHGNAMATRLQQSFEIPYHFDGLPILDAIDKHLAWWGSQPYDWRKGSLVLQAVVLADYISTRRNVYIYAGRGATK